MNLFYGVCIPTRLLIAFGGYKFRDYKLLLSIISIIIAIGFIYNDITKKKGFFGSDRYWSGITHAIFYLLFAGMLFIYPDYAWMFLVLDVLFGVSVYVHHYLRDKR